MEVIEGEVIKGVDTILGLVGAPPKVIPVPRKIFRQGTALLRKWNSCHLAFIPYCFKCREALDWYHPPTKDGFVFRCPKCDRKWVLKDED